MAFVIVHFLTCSLCKDSYNCTCYLWRGGF